MRHPFKIMLLSLFLMGCQPTNPRQNSPPVITWNVHQIGAGELQPNQANSTVHIAADATYNIAVVANSPIGLTGVSLSGGGDPICGIIRSSGLTYSAGNVNVRWATQLAELNPPVTSDSLILTDSSGSRDFTFSKIRCNAQVFTGPRTSQQAYALSGLMTLNATATDTQNRRSTGQLQIVVP
jgi:hypothetical protein